MYCRNIACFYFAYNYQRLIIKFYKYYEEYRLHAGTPLFAALTFVHQEVKRRDKIAQIRVDTSIVINVTLQIDDELFVFLSTNRTNWHISVKILKKLNVTLPIVIDRSLPQISLPTIVQIKVATLFKREGIFLLHFHLFHTQNLLKNMRHIIGKNPKMMCLILLF